MDNKPNISMTTLVIGFVLVIIVGASGYFLGKIIDTKKREIEIEEYKLANAKENPGTNKYTNSDMGFELSYPETWELKEDYSSYQIPTTLMESAGLSEDETWISRGEITIESPNGSFFVYMATEVNKDGEFVICAEEPETPKEGYTYNSNCLEKDTFSRYSFTKEGVTADLWKIAELHSDLDSTNRIYLLHDGFYYQVNDAEDIGTLDEIMATVKRL